MFEELMMWWHRWFSQRCVLVYLLVYMFDPLICFSVHCRCIFPYLSDMSSFTQSNASSDRQLVPDVIYCVQLLLLCHHCLSTTAELSSDMAELWLLQLRGFIHSGPFPRQNHTTRRGLRFTFTWLFSFFSTNKYARNNLEKTFGWVPADSSHHCYLMLFPSGHR